jgi:hypothetical protein
MAARGHGVEVVMLNSRLALIAAILSVAGFVAWLSLSDPAVPAPAPAPLAAAPATEDPPPAGSAEPCVVPLGWRISDIDPRFEVAAAQAQAVVARAASSWERAAGRPLFVHDPANGLPITFIYDERQAGAIERRRLERNLAEVDERLAAERRALEERAAAYDVRRALYEGRLREFERRAEAHADTVLGWNARGGAPPEVVPDLQAAEAMLDRERLELMRVGGELEEMRRALQADLDELDGRIDARQRRVDALAGSLPALRIESGLYRELVARDDGRVVALQRAIDVYRFESPEDLWVIVAHELGHALGLGHAVGTGAVMSEEQRRTERPPTEIQPDDLALLAARCPALVVSGPRRP